MIARFAVAALTAAFIVTTGYAQEGAEPVQPGIGQVMFQMLPMFILVYFIFYFLVSRPQEQKARQHKSLLENLKRGEMVLTAGGIIGRVAGIEKDHILLDVSNNVKIKVEKTKISSLWQIKDEQGSQPAKKKEAAKG